MASWLPIQTAEGVFRACYSETGLCRLLFPDDPRSSDRPNPGIPPSESRHWHTLTISAVKQILQGREPITLPPFDLATGTDFQQKIWRALLAIPIGQTRSYAEIAKAAGRPRAFRAAGAACGANPIPVLIPCHRVLAANQRIGGFSAGLDWKLKLLKREGVELLS